MKMKWCGMFKTKKQPTKKLANNNNNKKEHTHQNAQLPNYSSHKFWKLVPLNTISHFIYILLHSYNTS